MCVSGHKQSVLFFIRNAEDGYFFEVDLVPDQKKVNFHHWVGFLVHKGSSANFHPTLFGDSSSSPRSSVIIFILCNLCSVR